MYIKPLRTSHFINRRHQGISFIAHRINQYSRVVCNLFAFYELQGRLVFKELLKRMAKINANGNISYLLLSLVFMALTSMAGAVDIIFYSDSKACSGTGYAFNGVAKQVCCVANGGSVLLRDMGSCKTGPVYKSNGCSGNAAGSRTGNTCWIGGNYKAAYWYQSCRRRSLLGDVTSDKTECKSKANPTGVVYTEDSKKGTWVLKSSNAVEMFSHLESLPAAEKENWLKANGAVFDTSYIV